MEEEYKGKNTKVAILIIALVAIVLIIYGFYNYSRSNKPGEILRVEDNSIIDDSYADIINVKHQYKNGTHTYVGELNLPTPCHILLTEIKKSGTGDNKVTVIFKSSSKDTCAQVITPRPFKVSFEGPEKVNVTVSLDGDNIRFNIFEVSSNENLEDFDVNIKR